MAKHSTLAELMADPELQPALKRLARIHAQILMDYAERLQAEAAAAATEAEEKAS